MYQIHDIVASLVDNPEGVSSYKFKDKIGVVTGIEMIGGEQCYQVAFRCIRDLLQNFIAENQEALVS